MMKKITTLLLLILILALTACSGSTADLFAWLSPAFPIGSFAYSQGLEFAVSDGLVIDAAGLQAWLEAVTRSGSLWNDLVLLAAVRGAASREDIHDIAALSLALQPSRERFEEARLQGVAFADAFAAGWADLYPPSPQCDLPWPACAPAVASCPC